MSRGLKIFACVMVFFGVLSLIFLLTAKKKTPTVSGQQTSQTVKKTAPVKKVSDIINQNKKQAELLQAKKTLVRGQWQQCKDKAMAVGKNLFWTIQISEGIPAGGIYARGNLDNNNTYPVRVIIKPGIQNTDKINAMLTVGKASVFRGICTDVAPDGAVVFEAY